MRPLISIGDLVDVLTFERDLYRDRYDGGLGVVVDIDPTSDYPYKVIFDDAKTPEVRGEDGIWIWKELPMRKIERG